MKPGVWREVSISGEMFGLRHCRSAKHRGKAVSTKFFQIPKSHC